MRGMLGSTDAGRIVALVHRYSDLPPFEATMPQLVGLTGSDKKTGPVGGVSAILKARAIAAGISAA